MKNFKPYITPLIIGGALFAVPFVFAAYSGLVNPSPIVPGVSNPPTIVRIDPYGNVLMRGIIDSMSPNSMTIKSWGGAWIITIFPTTQFIPHTSLSQFHVGDLVGVMGLVSQNTSFAIDATLVRDWSSNTPSGRTVINGVSGPTVLTNGQLGAWTISTSGLPTGTVMYSVIWGDERIMAAAEINTGAQNTPVYTQNATLTHVYLRPGTYIPTFYVRDAWGITTSASLTVTVQ